MKEIICLITIFFNEVLITENDVMYLNLKQIDKTNKTLLGLRARCLGDRIKLQETQGNSKNHSVKGQVRNPGERFVPGLNKIK